MSDKLYPPMSDREKKNAALSRRAAAEGMVLLKNDNAALPLKGKKTALFGSGAVRTVRGGTGSGDPFNGGLSGGGDLHVDSSPRYHIYAHKAFKDAGWEVVTEDLLEAYAKDYDEARDKSNLTPMSVFAFPDMKITAEAAEKYASLTDTAVYVISRNSGEGRDRFLISEDRQTGDYLLSDIEKDNLKNLRSAFKLVILVLNTGGIVDLSYVLETGVDSILLMGQAGQESGAALMDVLTGTVNPSGKLTDTWAASYEDYPASATFAGNDGDPINEFYNEGIYVGYRYFDAFGITPLFPFGFGLSYTSFDIEKGKATLTGETLELTASVTNTGSVPGREVVQFYCSAPDGKLKMPVQELKGFAKTGLLQPGEKAVVTIRADVRDLASYDEERESFVLQEGDYILRLGSSSRDTVPAAILRVPSDLTARHAAALLKPEEPLTGISPDDKKAYVPAGSTEDLDILVLDTLTPESPVYTEKITTYTTDPDYKPVLPYETVCLKDKKEVTFADVTAGRASWEDLAAQISDEDLALITCGTGWGVTGDNDPIVGANSQTVRGAAGETTNALTERYGIPSIVLADGPAGIRITQEYDARNVDTGETVHVYRYCTAWPVGTLLAQTFDTDLIYETGAAIAEELQEMGICLLLGPGMNIHRDPLCGRNFEYFSEDPFLSGKCGAAITKGVQSLPGTGACIKHFAANNQETERATMDPNIGQRALREIYLRGFEIAVREGRPLSIMTAYNHVCSVPCGDSYELCTLIARDEWGFDGLIMTDWNGGCSTAWKSMHAGNDLIMPGGFLKTADILEALKPTGPLFDDCGQVLGQTSGPLPLPNLRWNSFTLSEGGSDTVTATLAEGHTAEASPDGQILVDGNPIYSEVLSPHELFRMYKPGVPFGSISFWKSPVTDKVAEVSADGKKITYRGIQRRNSLICRGDLQRCAIDILKVIARCQY